MSNLVSGSKSGRTSSAAYLVPVWVQVVQVLSLLRVEFHVDLASRNLLVVPPDFDCHPVLPGAFGKLENRLWFFGLLWFASAGNRKPFILQVVHWSRNLRVNLQISQRLLRKGPRLQLDPHALAIAATCCAQGN